MSQGKYRDASIACILRLTPPSSSISTSPLKFDSVDEVLNYMSNDAYNIESSRLEILFIKRAMRPGDPWGGHVAWPGGFLNSEESVVSGVRREVLEELGIDLQEGEGCGSAYTHLGSMTPTQFGPSSKTLNPHVYLKMSTEEPSFVLEEKEVDAVMWVNVQLFLQRTSPSQLDTHTVLAEAMLPSFASTGWKKKLVLSAVRLLGFDQWHFPCVRIPPRNTQASTAQHDHSADWVVWGLTFNTIRRLLKHVNGGQEYLAVTSPYRTENSIFNAFVSFFYRFYSRRHMENPDAVSPDNDKHLHRKILLSSVAGLAGVYALSASAGLVVYHVSTQLIANTFSFF